MAERHGVLGAFETPEDLVAAARRARAAGYRHMDAYSPMPVHGLSEALAIPRSKLPWLVLVAGVLGCLAGFALQYWTTVVDYPMNVGGRPLNSWPSFVPVMFECTVLAAALTAAIGMLAANDLPKPHHPVFAVDAFADASSHRFFLCLEASDPTFDRDSAHGFLKDLGASEVHDV